MTSLSENTPEPVRPYGYIYLVRNTVNGKVYIGQTVVDVATRWIKHLTYRLAAGKKKFPLYNAIKKYGPDAFTATTLTTASDRASLDLKERILIRAYRATDSSVGYNCRAGGCAGGLLTEATKAKISAANTGKVRTPKMVEAQRLRMLGTKQSEEWKAKRFANAKGRKMPPRTPEHARKLGDLKRGTKQSEETKELRAAKHRGRKNTPETIEKMRQSALNRRPEARENMRRAALNRYARERQNG